MIDKLLNRATTLWQYVSAGVWSDTRHRWYVDITKTLNLSVRSFMDRDLQSQAAAMTYKTLLAIVPALALMFAIAKGFGFQGAVADELYKTFPAQVTAIEKALSFVDSYLDTSKSEGIFVGVGIVFLLYTLISLLGSVEDSFNLIWGVKRGRTIGRKLTDYTAILLILPVLLICSSGITVFMSSLLQAALPFEAMTPVISLVVDFIGIVLGWCCFAGAYILIPNTRVKFKNAFIAGVLAGTAYYILQWLFVSGQIYVTKYNAIYGSFAFLPLLLLWLQMAWLIALAGGVLCYASQSIFEFSFSNEIARISPHYKREILLGVLLIIVKRRDKGLPPVDERTIAAEYSLPITLVNRAVNDLNDAGLVDHVIGESDKEMQIRGIAPAMDTDKITLGLVIDRLIHVGNQDFIPDFQSRFRSVIDALNSVETSRCETADKILLRDLPIDM